MQRTKLFPEHILKFKPRKRSKKANKKGTEEKSWMRRREFGFNLQLLSDGEIPIKEVNVTALLKGHKFTISQVCYAIILIINNIGLVDFFSVFFFVGRKLECKKIHDLLEMVAECYAVPHFCWAEKSMIPTTICVSPPPLINNRSLNNPHQRHYSRYLSISAFWGGVVKDREAPFSPNYVHLRSHVITRFFFICKSCGILILVVILCKLSTWPPIVTFRLYECNSFQMYF